MAHVGQKVALGLVADLGLQGQVVGAFGGLLELLVGLLRRFVRLGDEGDLSFELVLRPLALQHLVCQGRLVLPQPLLGPLVLLHLHHQIVVGLLQPVLNAAEEEPKEDDQQSDDQDPAHRQRGREPPQLGALRRDVLEHHQLADGTPAGVNQVLRAASVVDVGRRDAEGVLPVADRAAASVGQEVLGADGQRAVHEHEVVEAIPPAAALAAGACPLLPGPPGEVALVHRDQHPDAQRLRDAWRDLRDPLPELDVAHDLVIHPPGVDHPQRQPAHLPQLDAVDRLPLPGRGPHGEAVDPVSVSGRVVHAQEGATIDPVEVEVSHVVARPQLFEEGARAPEQPLAVLARPGAPDASVLGQQVDQVGEQVSVLVQLRLEHALRAGPDGPQVLVDPLPGVKIEPEHRADEQDREGRHQRDEDAALDALSVLLHGVCPSRISARRPL